MNENFQFNSDNSDEEAKGMNSKVEEPYFQSSFTQMPRPQEVHHRPSTFTFPTNNDWNGGMNRFSMGLQRSHDNIMENQYRKFDFPHNNKY